MPKPTTITATQLQKERGQIIRRCATKKEHFIVERDGYPLVAIIPHIQYQRLIETGVKF